MTRQGKMLVTTVITYLIEILVDYNALEIYILNLIV